MTPAPTTTPADAAREIADRLRELAGSKPGAAQCGYVTVSASELEYLAGRVAILSSALAGAEWRPIETAPKDGTKFLAWPCFLQANMAAAVETSWYRHPSVEGWTTDAIDCGDYEFEPTIWMPIPGTMGEG